MMKKTAFITGGAKGIGKKTALALAAEGFNIALNFNTSKDDAEELSKTIEKEFGVESAAFQGDISKQLDCVELVNSIRNHFGSIDVIIHNAGPYVKERKSLSEYEAEEWQYLINGNLNSAFYLMKEILPIMRENGWGRIVTFGFDRVETSPGWIYRSAFAAAKTGLASLTKTIALEEAANGITANMICPGDIIGEWKEKGVTEARLEKDSSVPVGRPGTGGDVARVVAFLCGEESDFITGSIIPVTGGKDVLGKVFYQ
ncbi:SDR family oxidoreductase [Falsibacillus pallidus]|uniref:SDR family oxidoreductase n=1 Tax=Falsibacillus pallidus TaxID=493781 RepID=UPI003D9986EB